MGYYRETDSDKYEFFYSLGKDPNTGKYIKKTKTFSKVRDGKKWLAKMEKQKNQNIIVDSNNYTINDLLEEWLENYAEIELSTTTVDGYKTIINVHLKPHLGKIKAKDLQGRHVNNYLKRKRKQGRADGGDGGLSSTTLLQHYRVLNQALKYGRKWKIISHDAMEFVDPPKKAKTKIKHINKEQVKKILGIAAEGWTHDFIYTAIWTGMRRGELLGLRWSDVELENKKIRVRQTLVHTNEGPIFKEPKSTQSIRTIDITEDLVEVLRSRKQKKAENKEFFGPEYNDKHNLVFAKKNGEYLYPKTSYRRVMRVLKKAELEEFNIKSFRHTHATFMLQNNIHPRVVQERLGHSNIEITLNIYSHMVPSMQKEASEKLENFLND